MKRCRATSVGEEIRSEMVEYREGGVIQNMKRKKMRAIITSIISTKNNDPLHVTYMYRRCQTWIGLVF